MRKIPTTFLTILSLLSAVSVSPVAFADHADGQQPLLPAGISEEEARWADWADWDKVSTATENNAGGTSTAPQKQELIAPQTDDDAALDQSASVGNEQLAEAAGSRQEAAGSSNSEFRIPNSALNNSIPADVAKLVEAIDKDVQTESYSHQNIRYLSSFTVRQTDPAPITPQIQSVLNRIRAVRRQYFNKRLNTDANSPFEAMMSVCAFGCYASIHYPAQDVDFNTAGTLCWNYPMCETSILSVNHNPHSSSSFLSDAGSDSGSKPTFSARYPRGRIVTVALNSSGSIFPYIGYCQQEREGEFLSMLAIARVSADYKFAPRGQMDIDKLIASDSQPGDNLTIRSTDIAFSVADLTAQAMDRCNVGDMSALLTGLSYYVPRETWTNAWGETWSVLRILDHELKRSVNLADSDSTDRLYALTYALRRRLAFDDNQLEAQYAVVDEYLAKMKRFALSIQNSDGSWNGAFFTRKGKSRYPDADFAATAHFARWLTILYHSNALNDPRLTKTMEYLVTELESRLESYDPSEMSQKDVRAVAYALQAIAIYQQRWTGAVSD